MKKTVKIGSRGSNLALIQANQTKDTLQELYPDINFEIVVIKTYGDKVLDLPLDKLNDKGVFVKEIEKALLEKDIDIAVHSMKDMPSEITPGLTFVNPPKAEDPSDVLILKKPISSLKELSGAKIGSGSKRRKYQLKKLINNLEMVPIRGNIETRMSKIEKEDLDGVILARAGIVRAGYEDRIGYVLDPTIFLPSPCQGILALQIRDDDVETRELLSPLAHESTTYRYESERAYQKEIGAGCHSPVGVYAIVQEESINIKGFYGDSDGTKLVYDQITGPLEDRIDLAIELAKKIKEALNG